MSDGRRDPYLGILEYPTILLTLFILLQNNYKVAIYDQYCPFLLTNLNPRSSTIRFGQSHAKQKQYFDRQARPLPPIEVGDSVRFQ